MDAKIKKGQTVMVRLDGRIHKVLVHRVHRDGTYTVACPPGYGDRPLLQVHRGELVEDRVRVEVNIEWGRKFNGSYNAPTPGEGMYVTVMEHEPVAHDRGPGFNGCPLGSGTTVEAAMQDFAHRAAYEYRGIRPLTRDMLEVVRTRDTREPKPTDR